MFLNFFYFKDLLLWSEMYMNKSDLIDAVSIRTSITKKDTEAIITVFLETIIEAVTMGERVTLVGFGSFEARDRKARKGINPQNGQKLYIPCSRVPTFSVGKFFKNKVNI
jgi:DNA-binding protein HU-beta